MREKLLKLPPLEESKPPHWDYWRQQMRDSLWYQNPITFCDWPVIRHTMLMDHLPIEKSADIVSANLPRYHTALETPKWLLSKGDEYGSAGLFSRTMIEQCAFIAMWERMSGRKIEDQEVVFEFGGGFGAMALLVRRLGFKGRYIIYDFPEMEYLQEWFLAENGVTDIDFQTDLNNLFVETDLLIAIDSISEVPFDLREKFWSHVVAKGMAIRYSPQWEKYDNRKYFFDFASYYGLEFAGWEATGWVSHGLVGWS